MDVELTRKLFYEMLRIRIIEECIAARYVDQQMRCPVHLCVGQEAVATGLCASLTNNDYCFGSHRSHGHYLAKGGNLDAMVGELYGKEHGCCRGKGGSMHLVDLSVGFLGATSIVASTIPIAVGAALGTQMRKENRIIVVFLGEAATEEGAFHEAANFAALKKLPILFLCENNLYSVYSPLNVRQPGNREVFMQAKGHGVDAHQGDGNDVLAVYDLCKKTVAQIRDGRGPVFLEFKTYRYREHCGPNYDDGLGYRPAGELAEWKKTDPVERMKASLLADGRISVDELKAWEKKINDDMDRAIIRAKDGAFPAPESLFEDVYA